MLRLALGLLEKYYSCAFQMHLLDVGELQIRQNYLVSGEAEGEDADFYVAGFY